MKSRTGKITAKYIYALLISTVAALILAYITVRGFDIISNATDSFLDGREIDFAGVLLKLGLFTAAGCVCAFIKVYYGKLFGVSAMRDLRNSVYEKLIVLEFEYYDKNGSGRLAARLLSDVKDIQRFLCEILPEILTSIVTAVIMLVYVYSINKMLLIAVAVGYPFVFAAVKVISRRITELAKLRRRFVDKESSEVYDIIGGVDIVKSYNIYDRMCERITKALDDIFGVEKKRAIITSLMESLRMLLKWIPSVICLCFGAVFAFKGRISEGELMVFVLAAERTFESLSSVPYNINESADSLVSVKRIDELLNEKEERENKNGKEPIDRGTVAIEFKNVTFGYGEGSVFDNLSFSVNKGEKIAFVGSSGSGKTTVFKIICGFYSPQEGEYLFFGNDFNKINIDAARRRIALISQDVFLFPTTIRTNLLYGNKDASGEEIENACKAANIHDFIMSLENGYDTFVGERGIKLSGGERQRISLARAFLKKADIFLLDEPTSALDSENEGLLNEAINKLDKNITVIIIAHRLGIAEKCDRIMVFENGKLCESGTHRQLFEKGGRYRRLYETAQGDEIL